ncbi:NAD(P)-dependent oxidoreductase [Thalassotalea mangrovi]|uniref:precorrin-2 dehydrogenase n=1 Tax=Thalassotalea mangrovi TaxID=2572245 RepID=A0A4U1B809_9GAMM|nr:NAD(P)-dependent oxidoreductase [Thalassotalea mangrovi]TKB46754.1 siroheme synthase [Thalassotalea mangrovi]
MQYFPIFLDAEKLNVVIVGGGSVAARKIELISKTPARVTIVSPHVNATVAALIERHNIAWQAGSYHRAALEQANLVIAATNNATVNAAVYSDASASNILVNVVDSPQQCTYITPAIIDRAPMLVALSSSGSAPILLQMLKSQIEQTLPSHYGQLAEFCRSRRHRVHQCIEDFAARKAFWQEVLSGEIAKLIVSGKQQGAEQQFEQRLQHIAQDKHSQRQAPGSLTLVVASDNNPDLLTLSAYQAMQVADVVYRDPLLSERFYEFARRDSEKPPEFESSRILADVQAGRRVVVITTTLETLQVSDLTDIRIYYSGKSN